MKSPEWHGVKDDDLHQTNGHENMTVEETSISAMSSSNLCDPVPKSGKLRGNESPPLVIAEDESTPSDQSMKCAETNNEEVDTTTSTQALDNTTEDLDDLLSMTVSKDYINCVWTTEPTGNRRRNSEEKKVCKSATNEVNAISDKQNGEVADNSLSAIPQSTSICSPPKRLRGPKKKPLKAKEKQEISVPPLMQFKDGSIISEDLIIKQKPKKSPSKKQPLVKNIPNPDPAMQCTSKPKFIGIAKMHKIKPDEPDESLFVALKKLLVQPSRPPPYSPKQLDPRFFSGNYFTCDACGDRYILETSLVGHMARKTAKFFYKCPHCVKLKPFENRCSLLLHMMGHGTNINSLNPRELNILLCNGEGSECEALFKNTVTNCCNCPDCSTVVHSLKLHLQGKDIIEPSTISMDSSLNCRKCTLVLPTKCAFSAHERYHRREPPYSCPECGDLFLRFQTLLDHMEENCLHNQKRNVFHCGDCKLVVTSINLFTEHMAKHVRPFYSCHICKVPVENFDDFNAHRTIEHNLPNLEPSSKLATACTRVKCDFCPGADINLHSRTVQEHVLSHTLDPKFMRSIFQCKDCKAVFPTKHLMLNHKTDCRVKQEDICDAVMSETRIGQQNGEELQLQSTDTEKVHVSHAEAELSSFLKNYIFHQIVNHDENEEECENLPPKTGEGKPFVAHQLLESQEAEVSIPEIVSSKQSHVLKQNVVCKLCKKIVSEGFDKASLKKHFKSRHFDIFMKAIHSGKNVSPSQIVFSKSKESVKEFLKSMSIPNKSDSVATRTGTKVIAVKGKPTKVFRGSKSPFRNVGKTLSPKRPGFDCYKCPFKSEDAEVFKVHIVSHKSNPSDLQCPKCGLCFIVRPPLEKHLIVGHGIKNVDKYLFDHGFQEHESNDEDEFVDVEEKENEGLEENQCKVCREKFDSAFMLEKHFRVHGGAFLLANLKAKRAAK